MLLAHLVKYRLTKVKSINRPYTRTSFSASGFELELLLTTKPGQRPDILFTHGACCQGSVWIPLMEVLRDSFGLTSAAFSLRGHGASSGKNRIQEYTIGNYVSDVESAISHLNISAEDRVVLVGHSMGGLISQLVASQHSDLLNGVVLLASSPIGGMMQDGMRMFLHHPLTFLNSMRLQSFASLYKSPEICRHLLFCKHTKEDVIREFMTGVQEESWKGGNEMNTIKVNPELVTCPVMVIGGKEDFMVSPASVERTAKAFKVSPQFIEKVGHMVQADNAEATKELATLIASLVPRRENE